MRTRTRLLTKILATAGIAAGLLFAAVGPAQAATASTAPAGSGAGTPTVVLASNSNWTYSAPGAGQLPFDVWQTATGTFHGKYSASIGDAMTQLERNQVQGTLMDFGNGVYQLTTSIVSGANNMSPLNAAGGQVDKLIASLGNSVLFGTGSIVVGILLLFPIFRAVGELRRGAARQAVTRLATAGISVGLLAVMVLGAGHSTTTNGTYHPGAGSPGWMATSINNAVSTVASEPVAALVNSQSLDTSPNAATSTCDNYVTVMHTNYTNAETAAGVVASKDATNIIVSELWEQSGMHAWTESQFGANNDYGSQVYCHLLDFQAGVSAKQQMANMKIVWPTAPASTATAAPWGVQGDNDAEDRSLIAWAACYWQGTTWHVRPAFNDRLDGRTIAPADCSNWWTGATDMKDVNGVFDVGSAASDANTKYSDPAVVNFVNSLHGNDINSNTIILAFYDFGAILVLLVFGLISLAIIVAKLASVAMLFGVIFVLLMSLIARESPAQKIMQYAKSYLGFSVLASGAALILAVICIFSKLFASLVPAGGALGMLWTGLAPVLACFLLHFLFTKVLKVPSVFKPSNALAWGAAGSAIGAGAGALFEKHENKAHGAVAGAGSKAGKAALSKVTGGRLGGNKGTTDRQGTLSGAQQAAANAPESTTGTPEVSTEGLRKTRTMERKEERGKRVDAARERREAVAFATGKDLDSPRVQKGLIGAGLGAAGAGLGAAALSGLRAAPSVAAAAPAAIRALPAKLKASPDAARALTARAQAGARARQEQIQGRINTTQDRIRMFQSATPDEQKRIAKQALDKVAGATQTAAVRGGKFMVTNPAGKAVSKVGAAAAVGGFVAGPVGAIGGVAVAGTREIRKSRDARLERLNDRVMALRTHRAGEQKAAEAAQKSTEKAADKATEQNRQTSPEAPAAMTGDRSAV